MVLRLAKWTLKTTQFWQPTYLSIADIAPNIGSSVKAGLLPVSRRSGQGTIDISYTILHLKVSIALLAAFSYFELKN